ncbi:MAG: glycoside hydrolase family 28 protein [Firmicutes bacterium]|nr:glycoside hydrolase family 28 protein [Bacillota bacterium]
MEHPSCPLPDPNFSVTLPAVLTETSVSITDYGAQADGWSPATEAINRAIEDVHAQGGGRVVIPPGLWRTGPIVLRSRVTLHVEAGALVLFSRRFDDYPLIPTYFEGEDAVRCQSPISGEHLEDVAITGGGIFDGGGDAWRPVKKSKTTAGQWAALIRSGGVLSDDGAIWWPTEGAKQGASVLQALRASGRQMTDLDALTSIRAFLRPNLVSLRHCRRILIDGPTFQNSPAWCLHPWQCQDVTIRHVTVRNPWYAQNGDGLDIDSCQRVYVGESTFDVGDDAICLKSGRIPQRCPPTAQVWIQHCTVFHGHGGVVIGSEMSGGVHDVYVEHCVFSGTDRGIRLKSRPGRGGAVERVTFQGIRMHDIAQEAVVIDLHYDDGASEDGRQENLPVFRDIDIREVSVAGARFAVRIDGLEGAPVSRIRLSQVTANTHEGVRLRHAHAVTIAQSRFRVADGPWLTADACQNVRLEESVQEGSENPIVAPAEHRH